MSFLARFSFGSRQQVVSSADRSDSDDLHRGVNCQKFKIKQNAEEILQNSRQDAALWTSTSRTIKAEFVKLCLTASGESDPFFG